ncbi:triphosphoribosyl-dephospho-CoA synthase CitG [Vibrio kasasachensis]
MVINRTLMWLQDDCDIYRPVRSGQSQLNISDLVGNLAYHAMMLEVHLTPKPGLVDCANSGAHQNMDLSTFVASCDALKPFMKEFVHAGSQASHIAAKNLLTQLRPIGIEAEKAMFYATNGVNTHKGMIFTLGLICGAVGWLHQNSQAYDAKRVREVIRACCASLVESELKQNLTKSNTAGERIYQQFGLTGIRGEAAAGYPTIFKYALPTYTQAIEQGDSEERSLILTLFALMAQNNDTTVINRAGLDGLNFVKQQAGVVVATCYDSYHDFEQHILAIDNSFIERNISPGGSADLLAATWLLVQLDVCSQSLIKK